MFIEEYISVNFVGRRVLVVASYDDAYREATKYQTDYEIIITFNPKMDTNLCGLFPTHWCVNLGTKQRHVPSEPIMTPYHRKWGRLNRTAAFFKKKGARLIHPQSELLQFEFELLSKARSAQLQPSAGNYLVHRLLAARVRPTLVGFTGQVRKPHHDEEHEAAVLNELEQQGLIARINVKTSAKSRQKSS